MSIQERKKREREEKRLLIINAAKKIMKTEGVDGISVRKIGRIIDYSPTMIYHYFKTKEDIINELMRQGYEDILNTLVMDEKHLSPTERFKKHTKEYIYKALEHPEEYKTVLLNDTETVLRHTSVLGKGAKDKRKAISILSATITEMINISDVSSDQLELLTQVVWSSMFGLIMRLIVEQVDFEQRNQLIDTYLNFTIENIKNFFN